MLTIRPQQMAVLNEIAERRFEQRMLSLIREDYSELAQDYPPDSHSAMLKEAIGVARAHGLTVEKEIFQFIVLSYMLGQSFLENEAYAWMNEILDDERIEPHLKLMQIRRRLDRQLAEELNPPPHAST